MLSFLRTRNVLHGFLGQNGTELIQIEGERLKQLQKCELDMLREILTICDDGKIDLMLGGGSLLGAVRHQGFIPWDDDIDLMIRREQVDRFCRLVKERLSEHLQLQYISDQMGCGFIKIRKKGTTYIEVGDDLFPRNNGVYLDIFIIENVPDSAIVSKAYGFCCNLRLYIATSVFMYQYTSKEYRAMLRQNRQADRNYRFRAALGFLFSWRNASGWFVSNDRYFSRYQDRQTKRVSIITGRGHYFGEMFPREVYAQTAELPFEDLTVKVPAQYETYLRQMYGPDFMQLPPVEKREHHYVVEIELGDAIK